MKRLFDDAQETQIVADYLAGESGPRIGSRLGTSKVVVRNILRRRGVVMRPKAVLSSEQEDEAIRLYGADELVRVIAARLSVSVPTIKNTFRKRRVPHRGGRKKYAIDHDVFAVVADERRAYLLGLIATDGSVSDRSLSIALQARDRDYLTMIRDALGCDVAVRDFVAKCGGKPHPSVRLTIYSRKIVADLSRHGIRPNKTHNLQWWDGPAHLMRHYVRGLVDGDGSISCRQGGGILGFCGTPAVAEAFAAYVARLFGVAPNKPEHRGAACVVTYSRLRSVQPILAHLYGGATISLGRKQATADIIVARMPGVRCRPLLAAPRRRP